MNYGTSFIAIMPILIVLATGVVVLLADACIPFWRTHKQLSDEAALKYFLLGAFAAGFLLYGIALIYGGSAGAAVGGGGTTNLVVLADYLKSTGQPSGMLMTGIALVMVGLGFKAALIPFHM